MKPSDPFLELVLAFCHQAAYDKRKAEIEEEYRRSNEETKDRAELQDIYCKVGTHVHDAVDDRCCPCGACCDVDGGGEK